MLVYTVSGHDYRAGRLGLLPGVPLTVEMSPRIGQLQQGSPIELRLPCGRSIRSKIEDYYVRVSQQDEKLLADVPPRIIILVPVGFTPCDIPIRTEIHV
jgi:hypothetical protein